MALSPDQLKRLSALLDAALDRPESMRASWLQQLDLDDPALLAMLQSALREDSDGSVGGRSDAAAYWLRSGRLSTLFATAASASAGQAPVESTPALAGGSAIGHYRLLREIGTGGMGVVWLAERSVGDIVRPVAIKLPLAMGAPRQIAERFHRERGVLARLAHPNIATLYDAGISDGGTPFLALEYVEGQTITRYCDTHRMTVSGRLELFGQVLSAVQHAHGRLVIHRDLKPANILVTAEGTVKLLDFGIAKLLEGDGVDDDLTRQVGVAITPNYASPEQLAGEPLTIATDLYSLGVVLYELLTGARPYHFKRDGQAALAQAIIAADIVPPSAAPIAADAAARRGTTMPRLRKMLRGDIDAITVKALEKPVARRYETAGAFAEDVAHHLRNEAVGAASAGASYRLRKFLLRHRVGVAAGSVAIAAVVAGSSVALWNLRETQRELMRRTTVQSFLIDMFKAADPEIARGRRYTAVDLLDRAGTRIGPTFAAEPEIEAALYGEVGAIYSALGEVAKANQYLARKIASLEASGHDQSADYVDALARYGRYAFDQGLYPEAERALDRAIVVATRLGRIADRQRRDAMLKLAHVLQTTGKYDRAVILLDATRDELRGLPAGTPLRDLPWRLEEGYGYLLYQRGDLAKSLERYRAASTLQASDASLERIDSIRVQLGTALVENALRRFEDAAQRMLPLIAELDRNHGPMAPDTLRCRNELARAYLGQGDYSKALSVQSEVVAAAQASGSAIETQLAQAFEIRMLVGLERYREAEELARSTLEFFSRQQSGPTRFTERLRALLAEITLATGRYAEAREYARQALDNQSRLFEPESPQIAQTLDVVGAIERAAGRPLDAEPPLARAQAIHVRQLGATHVYALRNALYLAISRVALQRPDAQAQFESAQRQLSAALPSMHPAQRQIARAVEAAQLAAGAHQPALVTRAELARFFLIDL